MTMCKVAKLTYFNYQETEENTQNFDNDLKAMMVVGRDSQEKEAFQMQVNLLYCIHKLINMTKITLLYMI